jgi:hypothetical protein
VLATLFVIVQVKSDMLERSHQVVKEETTYTNLIGLLGEGSV